VIEVEQEVASRSRAEGEAGLFTLLSSREGAVHFGGRIASELGSGFDLLAGRERTLIEDQDVEIAQGAVILDPVVDTAFAGLDIRGVIRRRSEGSYTLEASISLSSEREAPSSYDGKSEAVGIVQRPDLTVSRQSGSFDLKAGAPGILAEFKGRSEKTRILVLALLGEI
jgi:hypothetical protein